MIKFPVQFHGYKKTTLGDTIVSFRIDEMYSDQTLELAGKKIGTEFVIYFEDVTSSTNLNEDNKDVKERFWSKMHALINEFAGMVKKTPEEVKEDLKKTLKEKGLIESSTKELDIKGLAIACNILERYINEAK